MKPYLTLLFCITFVVTNAQDFTGKWTTIDDQTGKKKSVVEIFKKDNQYYGKIIKLINPKQNNPKCTKCKDELKNKPLLGLQIINNLIEKDGVLENGTILNPSNGKVYDCKMELTDNPNVLQVRGYIAFFYKTQLWQRVNP